MTSPELLPTDTLHVVIDMQRLFAEGTVWHTPGLDGILPAVARLSAARLDRAGFLRFVPPGRPVDAPGRGRRFYERWPEVTGDRLDPAMLDLVAPLAALASPDAIVDKPTFSMFGAPAFEALLGRRAPTTLVFSGVETDACVLASVLDAMDRGYRCVVVTDAVTSASLDAHEAVLTHVLPRQDTQVELRTVSEVLELWPG